MARSAKHDRGAGKGRPRGKARGLYGQRPSKCHDGLRREEFARVAAMSARERMVEALRLGEEISHLPGRGRRPAAGGTPK